MFGPPPQKNPTRRSIGNDRSTIPYSSHLKHIYILLPKKIWKEKYAPCMEYLPTFNINLREM